MNKYKSAVQWLVLGAFFMIALVVYGYLRTQIYSLDSSGMEVLASGILGGGGILSLLIGIIKALIAAVRK